eukprot:CAMPEP_0180489282 /NCGR_PEP_ID=MMETSP1036_2-20121128/38506_1 /TAXON_ID=632150 /ORGANISM="Azadinium spinosum, Strain 3D9" /LENGTH=80 /DNA_ID=CAMNT_0022497413 /DNA_START=355 /DNA_END=594 /DNA_ORIENTATION=-
MDLRVSTLMHHNPRSFRVQSTSSLRATAWSQGLLDGDITHLAPLKCQALAGFDDWPVLLVLLRECSLLADDKRHHVDVDV